MSTPFREATKTMVLVDGGNVQMFLNSNSIQGPKQQSGAPGGWWPGFSVLEPCTRGGSLSGCGGLDPLGSC